MYVSETESAAEKFCQVNQVALPDIKGFDEALHYLDKSRYRIERSFNALSPGLRDLLKKAAGLDKSDSINPYVSGTKLHHYTRRGQLKLAHALREVRLLSQAFPKGIKEGEFTQTDRRGE